MHYSSVCVSSMTLCPSPSLEKLATLGFEPYKMRFLNFASASKQTYLPSTLKLIMTSIPLLAEAKEDATLSAGLPLSQSLLSLLLSVSLLPLSPLSHFRKNAKTIHAKRATPRGFISFESHDGRKPLISIFSAIPKSQLGKFPPLGGGMAVRGSSVVRCRTLR